MDISDLIDAAESAKAAVDTALANAQSSAQTLRDAVQTMNDANQAVHDDLSTNGSYMRYVPGPPPTATYYVAVDPDNFSATPVRTS